MGHLQFIRKGVERRIGQKCFRLGQASNQWIVNEELSNHTMLLLYSSTVLETETLCKISAWKAYNYLTSNFLKAVFKLF